MRLFSVLCLVALAEFAQPRLAAQGTTAAILGTVTDSSGAAIVGANVQVSNTGTGQVQSTVTDAVVIERFVSANWQAVWTNTTTTCLPANPSTLPIQRSRAARGQDSLHSL
jgi:hypothetical protein